MSLDGGGCVVGICIYVCSGFAWRFTNGKLLNEFVFNFFPHSVYFSIVSIRLLHDLFPPFLLACRIVHNECIYKSTLRKVTKLFHRLFLCVRANNSRCGCCSTFIVQACPHLKWINVAAGE